MTLSEKLAYDSIEELTKDSLKDMGDLFFILQVAHDNDNWSMVFDLVKKISSLN